MNLGLRKMQISSAAVPPIRMRPISAAPARRRSAPALRRAPLARPVAPRSACCHALEADAARALHEHRVAARAAAPRSSSAAAAASRTLCASPANAVAHLGGQRPDGHEQLDPARGARARRSRGAGAALAGPSSSMSPSTATRRPARRLGEVVERGAHRHRVGVVAVVDQRPPRRAARTRSPRSAEKRRPASPRGVDAERPRGRHRGEQVAQVVRLREGRLAASIRSAVARSSITTAVRRGARDREPRHRSPPSPKVIACAGRRADAASSSGSPAGTTDACAPARRPAISSALAAAIASSEPSSSRCTGPTLTITPTSGSAIAVSSAIWPAPRIAISSTSASVSRGRREHRQRQADLGVEVLGARDRAQLPCASSAARMSLVEVLPVEPVIATTFAPAGAELAPPGARERLQARAAGRGARARCARAGCAGAAASACSGATSTPHAPAASACARMLAAVGALAAQADEQLARRARARESIVARRGPGAVRRAAGSSSGGAAPRDAPRAPVGCTRRLHVRSRVGARAAPSRGDRDVVEGHLAPVRELLALLVALAGDHDARRPPRAARSPRRSPRAGRRSSARPAHRRRARVRARRRVRPRP